MNIRLTGALAALTLGLSPAVPAFAFTEATPSSKSIVANAVNSNEHRNL